MALKHARPCLPSTSSGICVHLRERGRSPSRRSAWTGSRDCCAGARPAPQTATAVDGRAVPPGPEAPSPRPLPPVCPDSLSPSGHRHWARAPDPARPHLPSRVTSAKTFVPNEATLAGTGCRFACLWGTRFSPQQPPLRWAPLGPGVPSPSLSFPCEAEGSRPWPLSQLPGALSAARFPAQPGSPPASALSEHPSLRPEVKP